MSSSSIRKRSPPAPPGTSRAWSRSASTALSSTARRSCSTARQPARCRVNWSERSHSLLLPAPFPVNGAIKGTREKDQEQEAAENGDGDDALAALAGPVDIFEIQEKREFVENERFSRSEERSADGPAMFRRERDLNVSRDENERYAPQIVMKVD